jgi:hypothetical protein
MDYFGINTKDDLPKINEVSSSLTADGTVEERLIRKGEEYKTKRY